MSVCVQSRGKREGQRERRVGKEDEYFMRKQSIQEKGRRSGSDRVQGRILR